MDARTPTAPIPAARAMGPEDVNGAVMLAQAVGERVHVEAELRASEERLRLAIAATGLGVFDWDLATDLVTVNARFREMFALPPGGDVIGAALLGGVVHPEDQAMVEARLGEAFDPTSSGAYEFEHRAVTAKGEIWLLTFGQVYFAGEGRERRAVRIIGNDLDITERKRAEAERDRLAAEVANERERLRAVVLHGPAPLALLEGPEHRFTLVNDAFKRVSGGGRDVTGLTPQQAFPELAGAGIYELYDQVYETGEPWIGRETLVRYDRDGTGIVDTWFDLRFDPVRDAEGQVFGVFNFAVDVTEQVRARHEVEQLLADSEATQHELEAANAQLQDQALELELANQQLQDNAVELEASNEELQSTTEELVDRSAAAELAGQALAESERQFRTLADAIPTLAWTAQADGHIDWYNSRWYEYTGTTPDEMAGWGWQSVHDPAELPWVLDRWRAGIATGNPVEMTFPLRRADGVFRRFLTRIVPVRDPEGHVLRWFGTNTDVEEERAARVAAEAANRAKSEFLAMMSHELRTPLNAIGGYTELLEMGLRGPITDEQRLDLGRIQSSQRHLLGLVNQVLDLAKDEAGALRVERAAVRSGDTVDAALGLVRPQASAKGLALNTACEGAADRQYLGDEPRVRQALVNLLANAIKFTEPGGQIRVACTLTDSPPAEAMLISGVPYVALRVQDTGVGIPLDQQSRLFEPFTQIEHGANTYTRATGGTGLGLAISRRLARLMGGDLTVESRAGAGSTFTLWLPTPDLRATPRATMLRISESTPGTAAGSPGTASAHEMGAGQQATGGASDPAEGIARIGEGLVADVGGLLQVWVTRLQGDEAIPSATGISDLEAHVATFITGIGLALRTLGRSTTEPVEALRDSRAILAVVAERHGVQRARLDWPEAAVVRELEILSEVMDAALVRIAGPGKSAAADRARATVEQLLAQGLRVSLGSFRLAAESNTSS